MISRCFKVVAGRTAGSGDYPKWLRGKPLTCPACGKPEQGNVEPGRLKLCGSCSMSASMKAERSGLVPEFKVERKVKTRTPDFKSAGEARQFLNKYQNRKVAA